MNEYHDDPEALKEYLMVLKLKKQSYHTTNRGLYTHRKVFEEAGLCAYRQTTLGTLHRLTANFTITVHDVLNPNQSIVLNVGNQTWVSPYKKLF